MVLHCLHEIKYPVTSLGSFNSSVSYPVAVISAPHFVQLAIILYNESKNIQYQSFLSEVLTNVLDKVLSGYSLYGRIFVQKNAVN
jgi:hypothetical protein